MTADKYGQINSGCEVPIVTGVLRLQVYRFSENVHTSDLILEEKAHAPRNRCGQNIDATKAF